MAGETLKIQSAQQGDQAGLLDQYSRELYKTRVSAEIFTRTNFFDRAIADIVIRPKGHVKSKIW